MTRQTEVYVDQLRREMEEQKTINAQLMAAVNAIVEQLEELQGHNSNAVIEGDEIVRPARNGKLKKDKANR
jgi:hypothetical protein